MCIQMRRKQRSQAVLLGFETIDKGELGFRQENQVRPFGLWWVVFP